MASSNPGNGKQGYGNILPRSVVGVAALLVAAAIGAALSGTILYAYYQYRQTTTESRVNSFINGFDKRYGTALSTIQADSTNAQNGIAKALEPLVKNGGGGGTLNNVLRKAAPAVWFVHTLGPDGAPSVGSAVAVASDSGQTLLLTSYSTVQAATHSPGPTVYVRKNNTDTPATLYNWQPGSDLALLKLNMGHLATLTFSTSPATVGQQLFAVSGVGSNGGSVSPGQVNDASTNLIQNNVPIGPSFQGGPLLDASDNIVGIASLTYSPLGFPSTGIYFGVPIQMACTQVLKCPGGTPQAGSPSA